MDYWLIAQSWHIDLFSIPQPWVEYLFPWIYPCGVVLPMQLYTQGLQFSCEFYWLLLKIGCILKSLIKSNQKYSVLFICWMCEYHTTNQTFWQVKGLSSCVGRVSWTTDFSVQSLHLLCWYHPLPLPINMRGGRVVGWWGSILFPMF